MWADQLAQSRLVTDLLPSVCPQLVGVASHTARLACTGAPMSPSLFPCTYRSLHITLTAGMSRALVTDIHEQVSEARKINSHLVVTEVRASLQGLIGSHRFVTTGFTLAKTLKTKAMGGFNEWQTRSMKR